MILSRYRRYTIYFPIIWKLLVDIVGLKALMHAAGSQMRLRTDLTDLGNLLTFFSSAYGYLGLQLHYVGVCLVSHWLLEFIVENQRFSSVRNDVVPFIVNRQFQSEEYLFERISALEHRRRPLRDIENWLTSDRSETMLDMRRQQKNSDPLRVFAHIVDLPKEGSTICTRMTTLASYVALNK